MMIPKVRHWRVRYYLGKTLLAEVVVATINKQFARWLARDHVLASGHWQRVFGADRVTVGLLPLRTMAQRTKEQRAKNAMPGLGTIHKTQFGR